MKNNYNDGFPRLRNIVEKIYTGKRRKVHLESQIKNPKIDGSPVAYTYIQKEHAFVEDALRALGYFLLMQKGPQLNPYKALMEIIISHDRWIEKDSNENKINFTNAIERARVITSNWNYDDS
jgi:hypothetical protein